MTQTPMRIAIAQINPTVGDLAGNLDKIRKAMDAARMAGAGLLVTPEMSVTGYPAEDLVLKPFFIKSVRIAVEKLARETAHGPTVIVGAPWEMDGALYNAALVLDGGEVRDISLKTALPNYGIFDEKRVFRAGQKSKPVHIRGHDIGLMVCEDMWFPDCARILKNAGAEILVTITASPFETDKQPERLFVAQKRASETGLSLICVNQVGGQDEVIFDGTSFALSQDGRIIVQCAGFKEDFQILDFIEDKGEGRLLPQKGRITAGYDDLDAIYQATMLGLRDYVDKNGFPGVLIGLSGGLDSALTAAIAVDALGPARVRTVMMPSRYTSRESLEDAALCAQMLGIKLDTIPINPGVEAFQQMLTPIFKDKKPDITEENIQSRLRGVTLMALSNTYGDLVLTTGNKSEISVGYSTLYGDMCGGYSVLKDIYKTTAFALSRRRNMARPHQGLGPDGPVMPERIITKPPSAELRPDQKDEDSLPPYEILDDILECLVEGSMASADIIKRGHDAETVARVEHLLYVAEYKRRQAAPGVKITRKSFGRDRRYPITNGFRTARYP